MAKKHFTGKGKSKIHTSRGPACKKKCAYKTAAANKFTFQPQAAHHIIPVSAFIAYQDDEELESVASQISDVYRATDYCANQAANLINLPRKTTYSKQKKRKVWPAVWSLNLSAHNWDHPEYTKEVRRMLKAEIWSKFVKTDPPVTCPDEEATATAFKAIETYFRDQLTTIRPARPYGGTLPSIQAAENGQPDWWKAFSMAENVRQEPVFVFAAKSGVPEPLQR